MIIELTPEQVWEVIEKNLFGVIGMVTKENEARTVGIVYVVRDRRLYIGTGKDTWKVRHVAQNPHVSMTIPVHKGIPLMPFIKIPAATITFCGEAKVIDPEDTPPEILQAIYRGMAEDNERVAETCLIEVTPVKDFITYGIGIPMMKMRDPDQARGRAPVGV
ncbi:MAG: pyridoxamine 5'-phosphate oxidase family protein [Candidatus Promineifilaceae bacterium]|jgi:hypothetical protein